MNKRTIRKVLIANRGEIALRVVRACKELDVRTVVVYSDVDRTSLFVQHADEAYHLPGEKPTETYLDQKRILEIARNAAVDAIHPGYGFLAENPSFAEATEKAGFAFIGPTAQAIRLMGDKTAARRLARIQQVPTIAGMETPIGSIGEGERFAEKIGYPVLLKAAAGGGGKGMRIVSEPREFAGAFRASQSEARSAFGDERVFIEKYLEAPRHVEIQILADRFGNAVYLGERECSIQRRHQKVVEESPSPVVSEQLRKSLGEAAVRLAKAAGYISAGTMEFLIDTHGNPWFLEMNTRLQVEHPVTEMLTGIDLVKEQIRIAEGIPLRFRQEDIRPTGHAIECRICAEDPENDFLPSTGRLLRYRPPQGNVRVDNGFREGDEVSVFYDSLLCKVITWGPTRSDSIDAMKRALTEFVIGGVKSTIPFCQMVLSHPSFLKGEYNTKFIEKHFHPGGLRTSTEGEELAVTIVAALLADSRQPALFSNGVVGRAPESRWKSTRREHMR